jgi:hypothetical protein
MFAIPSNPKTLQGRLRTRFVRALTSPFFLQAREAFERASSFRSTEEKKILALDLTKEIGEEYALTLYLLTLLSAEEIDALAILARSARRSWKAQAYAWDYDRAARAAVAAPNLLESWKVTKEGKKAAALREDLKAHLRSLWLSTITSLGAVKGL